MEWKYPVSNRGLNKSTVIIIVLAIGLVAALGVIVYQRYFTPRGPQASQRGSATSNPTSTVGFSSFLASLKNSDAATKRAHQDFYRYLSTLNANSFPTDQDLRQLLQNNDVPHDYAFFFKESLPSYSRSLTASGTPLKDQNIIVSIPSDSGYKASLFVNGDNLPMEAAYNAANPQATQNRLIISGAYTSPTRVPAGLTIDKGRVVNPVIQDFDGILEIFPDGRLQIAHVDALQNNLKGLRIRSSFQDYLEFMRLAEGSGLTVVQSNLLLNNGEVLVQDDPLLKKLQRRVLFQTADGSVHVYDSLDKEQTLFETAKILKERFRAHRAINFETGSYSFCTINRNNKLVNRTSAKPGTIISNFLIIDF